MHRQFCCHTVPVNINATRLRGAEGNKSTLRRDTRQNSPLFSRWEDRLLCRRHQKQDAWLLLATSDDAAKWRNASSQRQTRSRSVSLRSCLWKRRGPWRHSFLLYYWWNWWETVTAWSSWRSNIAQKRAWNVFILSYKANTVSSWFNCTECQHIRDKNKANGSVLR
jgi:hypothetical protein